MKDLHGACVLTPEIKVVLDEIVKSKGKCLSVKRCKQCPLRETCLSRFYNNSKVIAQQERYKWAVDALWQDAIEDITDEDILNERFDKKS
jgi:hypothetical protein